MHACDFHNCNKALREGRNAATLLGGRELGMCHPCSPEGNASAPPRAAESTLRFCQGLARLGQADCDELDAEEKKSEVPIRREGSLSGSSRAMTEYASVSAQVLGTTMMLETAWVAECYQDMANGFASSAGKPSITVPELLSAEMRADLATYDDYESLAAKNALERIGRDLLRMSPSKREVVADLLEVQSAVSSVGSGLVAGRAVRLADLEQRSRGAASPNSRSTPPSNLSAGAPMSETPAVGTGPGAVKAARAGTVAEDQVMGDGDAAEDTPSPGVSSSLQLWEVLGPTAVACKAEPLHGAEDIKYLKPGTQVWARC